MRYQPRHHIMISSDHSQNKHCNAKYSYPYSIKVETRQHSIPSISWIILTFSLKVYLLLKERDARPVMV
jgi:hypothetical protein